MAESYLLAFVLFILKLIERSLLKWPSFVCKYVNEVLWTIIWLYCVVYWYESGAFNMLLVPLVLYGMSVVPVDAFLKLYSLYTKKYPGPAKYFLNQGRYLKANRKDMIFNSYDFPFVSLKQPAIRETKKGVFSTAVDEGRWLGITGGGICGNSEFRSALLNRTHIPVVGFNKQRVRFTIEVLQYSVGDGVDPFSEESLTKYLNAEADYLIEHCGDNWIEKYNVIIKPWNGVSKGEVLAYQIYTGFGSEYKLLFPADKNSFLCLVFYDQTEMKDRIDSFPVEEYIRELADMMEIKCVDSKLEKLEFKELAIKDRIRFDSKSTLDRNLY